MTEFVYKRNLSVAAARQTEVVWPAVTRVIRENWLQPRLPICNAVDQTYCRFACGRFSGCIRRVERCDPIRRCDGVVRFVVLMHDAEHLINRRVGMADDEH